MDDGTTSADSFRELAEGLPQLVWTCRADGSCDYLSRQWVQYTGKPEAEQLGSGWLESVHPEDRQGLVAAWSTAVQQQGTLDTEFRLRRHDGTYRWFKTRAVPLKDAQGNVKKWIGSNTDIEDLRSDEQALRPSEAQLRSVVESLSEGIIIADLQGNLLHWNRAALEMHGFATVDEVRRHLNEFANMFELSELNGQVIPPDQWPLRRILCGEVLRDLRLRVRRKQGEWMRIYNYGGALVHDANDQPMLAMLTLMDITGRIDEQIALQRAKDTAEAASRTKDHFLAMVSHELRTPLTPVLAAASQLRNSPDLPVALRDDVEVICRNVEVEARLVNDLLNLTRLARGKIVLHQEAVELNSLIRNLVGQFQQDFDRRKISLHIHLPEDEVYVWGDPMRLQQVLGNLLSNAEKFTPAGGEVVIECSTDKNRCRIVIRDNGIGIEPEVMSRLFNPFEQGERTVTRKFGGLGLGLSIARQLIELHGGTLTASSGGKDCGATFTIDLAAAPMASSLGESIQPAPAPSGGLSILLVEDHPDTLRTMSRLLHHLGHRVEQASNVTQALDKAQHVTFDVLLSDIGLPDGSGLDIVRELRRRGAIQSAIALSGFGQTDDIQRSKEAGFAEHLVKPIDVMQLHRALNDAAQASGSSPTL